MMVLAPLGLVNGLKNPCRRKKHFPSFFAGPGPGLGPVPRAQAWAPAKKDGKFKQKAPSGAQMLISGAFMRQKPAFLNKRLEIFEKSPKDSEKIAFLNFLYRNSYVNGT